MYIQEADLKKFGAEKVVISTDEQQMKEAAQSQDIILNTISADHDLMQYQALLRPDGVLVQLGLVKKPHSVPQTALIFNSNAIAGSLIGGVRDTQEVRNLAAYYRVCSTTVYKEQHRLHSVKCIRDEYSSVGSVSRMRGGSIHHVATGCVFRASARLQIKAAHETDSLSSSW